MTNQPNDTYSSKKECQDSKYNRKQTNSRYPHFKQHHYTVGDEEQFDSIISTLPEITTPSTIEFDKLNIFHSITGETFWEGYRQQERINIIQTFRYIFYKIKKGIYIRIQNNKVYKFIPLSNANFVNEWSAQLEIDYSIFKKVNELENRPYDEKKVNKFVQNWFCNNCLLRYEYPINESDTNTSNIKNFFDELCLQRKIPDIEFFVNKRDFPLLTTNATEPYYDIWGYDKPLVSHKYSSYLPILSMSKTSNFADILIPTHEDWARVQQKENKWFIDSRVANDDDESCHLDFKHKKSTAVFRGSSTGNGFTIESNQRLKIAYLSSQNKVDEKNIPYLNCGITKWNTRPKKMANSRQIQMINPETLPFSLVEFMTLSEQSQYKYIVHIDGHVSAFRLSAMLSLNCVPLIVESVWNLWYSHLLIPYEHFIPIKADLSNLYEQIDWCKNNDDACEMIASNALEFAETYLEKNGMFDYTQKILTELKCFMKYTPAPSSCFPIYPTLPIPDVINTMLNTPNLRSKVFENRNVIVTRFDSVVVKERKHNLLCSHNIINFSSPNFSRVYGYNNQNHVVMEYIDGIKLYDFLADTKLFDFQIYIDVLIQISLALHEAQKEVLFVHNDLTPWNIILKYYDTLQYLTYDNGNYHLATHVVPVIIDYDKSHIIDNHYIHHGSVNAYKFSSIQDILSLLFTSLFQIISNHKLNHAELKGVLQIANFISNTTFYPHTFKSIHQLKGFLFSMKKHSALIYTDKMDLEHLNPLNFILYLKKQHFHMPSILCQTPVSSYDATYEFDKYIFWSHSKTTAFYQTIQSVNVSEMVKEASKGNLKMKRNLANIQTFHSLYK